MTVDLPADGQGSWGEPLRAAILQVNAAAEDAHERIAALPPETSLDLDHQARVGAFLRARGGAIGTGGKAAVALRFDHGLANFKATILPLLRERGLPSGLALNTAPDKWALSENAGAAWEDVRAWSLEDGVEVWNHSHTHADSVTDEEIVANVATDPLAVFEAELPNYQVEGFVVPGGDASFSGWTPTNTTEHFSAQYTAGRAVLRNHAACTGHLGGVIRPLSGRLTNGQRHQGMDTVTSATTITDVLKRAQDLQSGVQLMMHPSVLNLTGSITTAVLTSILDWIVTERDAGRLAVLSMSGLLIADVRTDYRHNILRGFAPEMWTNTTGYTFTDGVVSSASASATMRQNVNFTDIEAVKGRVRELTVEARSTGASSTLRMWVSSTGTVGSMSSVRNFSVPGDGQWRTYRRFFTPMRSAFSANVDIGRVGGTGALEMRNPRALAV